MPLALQSFGHGHLHLSAAANLGASHDGNVLQPGTVAANDIATGRHTLIDPEARLQSVANGVLAISANNLFDIYPHTVSVSLKRNNVTAFPYYSPSKFNWRNSMLASIRAGEASGRAPGR